jgi:ribosomal protein S18 acetylase RimI-like enzyme
VQIQEAADVFCRSFAFTRSFTYPFEYVRIGGLRIMRDAVSKKDPRTQEIVVCGLAPQEALREIHSYGPPKHLLCAIIGSGDNEAKAAYKAGGYRMLGSEDLFVRDLRQPIAAWDADVRRIETQEDADLLTRAAGRRQILTDHISGDQVRSYAAFGSGQVVGWVRSIHLQPDAAWVSNLQVRPEFRRRRGLATALMSRRLRDDARHGAKWSVLLASHAGSLLYPKLGYERLGVLLMFSPVRS